MFRAIQRIERGLGQPLFERSRTGYLASELAQSLAAYAEQMETALESARSATQQQPEQVSGTVRLTTTDTLLHGLIAPALKTLSARHPLLSYELHAGNELASLTRRDADIAVRATKRPPEHLVGKALGPIRVAVFAAAQGEIESYADVEAGKAAWIAPGRRPARAPLGAVAQTALSQGGTGLPGQQHPHCDGVRRARPRRRRAADLPHASANRSAATHRRHR